VLQSNTNRRGGVAST